MVKNIPIWGYFPWLVYFFRLIVLVTKQIKILPCPSVMVHIYILPKTSFSSECVQLLIALIALWTELPKKAFSVMVSFRLLILTYLFPFSSYSSPFTSRRGITQVVARHNSTGHQTSYNSTVLNSQLVDDKWTLQMFNCGTGGYINITRYRCCPLVVREITSSLNINWFIRSDRISIYSENIRMCVCMYVCVYVSTQSLQYDSRSRQIIPKQPRSTQINLDQPNWTQLNPFR